MKREWREAHCAPCGLRYYQTGKDRDKKTAIFHQNDLMSEMRALDVCPTEDAIKAFLDCLVDPILPAKSSGLDSPSLPQQELVAKQVHAVAILYNYYHRKQCPELEFLDFLSFCKLAVLLRPALLAYMNFIRTVDDVDMSAPEIKLSVTESKIMEAYDIFSILDVSKQIPNMEGWPASRVAIFLVDSRKNNCFLVFDSLARGVWSIIAKDLDVSNKSQATPGVKSIVKKKKIIRRPTRDDSTVDEDAFRRHAFLAVEEETGINQTDLLVLESHPVYSLTKEKSVSRFYIMQCKHHDKDFQFPIKDIIDRLHDPLISRMGLSWSVTPVVEYFYVLPYAGILSAWFSREVSPDSFKKWKVNSEIYKISDSKQAQSEPEIKDCRKGSHAVNTTTGGNNKKTNDIGSVKCNEKQSAEFVSHDPSGAQSMDVDTTVSEDNKQVLSAVQDCQEKAIDDLKGDLNGVIASFQKHVAKCEIDETVSVNISKSTSSGHNIMVTTDHDLLIHQLCPKEIDKLHDVLNSKENDLSQTAIRVILRERAKLSHQLRNIKDEIAQCNEKLRKIAAGGEDALELKLQCLLDEKNPCQELDCMCDKNNWILPIYHVSLCEEGGFIATVTMQDGIDPDRGMAMGEPQSVPHKARESAAARLLAQLTT